MKSTKIVWGMYRKTKRTKLNMTRKRRIIKE